MRVTNYNNFKILILIFIATTLFSSSTLAVKYDTKKKFVKRNIPAGSKLSKSTIQLTEQKKKELVEKWNWTGTVKKMSFVIARDAQGKIGGVIYFTTLYATEHECIHKLGVALGPEGSVKEVVIFELFCERAMPVSAKSFLGQFRKKPAKELLLNDDISAITDATESSKTVLEAVNSAMAGYSSFIQKQNEVAEKK